MIISSVGSAIIGGLAGGIGSYIAQEKVRANRKEEKIQQLRQSLLTELSSFDELVHEQSSNYKTQVPANELITPEVYRANSSQISLLTSTEAQAVIRFYTSAIMVNNSIQTARNLIAQSDNPEIHDHTSINTSIDRVRQDWINCVLELMSNLDEYPSQAKVDGDEYTLDKDTPAPILWNVLNQDRVSTEIEFEK